MDWLTRILGSTVGKKYVVGISGLLLVGFLATHLVGNLLMYVSPEAFNGYTSSLHELGPLLLVLEFGLLAIFLVHIGFTIALTKANREARGSRYAVTRTKKPDGPLALLASRMMPISGLILLGFLLVHIWDFRIQWQEDLFALMDGKLQELWRVALYTVASVLIGWHLFHGFQSAFKSLGMNHSKFTPLLARLGMLLAVVFGLGFASFPIWIAFVR